MLPALARRQYRHRRPWQNTHLNRDGYFAMARQRKIEIINPRGRRRQIGKRGADRKPVGKIGKPFMRVERFFIQLNRQGHFFNLTGAHLAKNLQSQKIGFGGAETAHIFFW